MVIHMVKPIPMKESRPSRITIAHAMWGRNYAYDDFTEAIRLNGASYLPYSYRGSAFENKGELDKALADFRAALSKGSTTASADINRVERRLQALRDQRFSQRPIYCGNPRMCSNPETAKVWLNFTAAYHALYFHIDSGVREAFESGEQQWRTWLAFRCALSFDQDVSFSPQQRACVAPEYSKRASKYRSELAGDALAEANLKPEDRAQIQEVLRQLGHLHSSADGLFGEDTRRAIKEFQARHNFPQTDFLTMEQRQIFLTYALEPISFIPYQNKDINGGDFQRLNNLDFPACKSACKSDSKCIAYSFDRWNSVCFLKSTIGPLRIEPRSTTGVRWDMQAPGSVDEPLIMQRYRGRTFPGNGYSSSHLGSSESCENTCKNASECIAYSFIKAPRRCKLFSDTGEYFSDNRVDSGVKIQPAQR